MIKLWVYTCTWWGPYPFHGGWPLVFIARQRPTFSCSMHLAVMPFEPLTFVLVHLPLLPFQSS